MTKPRRGGQPEFSRILDARLSRRQALGLGAAATSLAALGSIGRAAAETRGPSSLTFPEVAHGADQTQHVARGYRAEILIRWGDPLLSGAPAFDPANLSGEAQARQFGYNNDFAAFMPLPWGSKNSSHGLLCVNHEYTVPQLMWPGIKGREGSLGLSQTQVDVEMAAHGHSVVELRKTGGRWAVVPNSAYARRITASGTEMRLAGPAAGDARLKTFADPSGTRVIGTVNNCSGGVTPWGTILFAEENFPFYFGGAPSSAAEAVAYKRYGLSEKSRYSWWQYQARFDLSKEPNEPNRFGWMVEYDPYDPASVPVKRTALGRFRHEGAGTALTPDGRAVLYMGDDQAFEYFYRFVSAKRVDLKNRAANRDVLDEGTLSVARFDENGVARWLPLVWGQGPLTPANGFNSPADVMIEARRAADLVGATGMDRPEDADVDPATGRIYAVFTNNSQRTVYNANPRKRPDPANPRPVNRFGHIIELAPPGDANGAPDNGAEFYRWDIFLLAGDPRKAEVGARYNPGVSDNGWLACPDNVAFDPKGRLWIATDQGDNWQRSGSMDGLYGCDVSGPGRALTRFFYRVPAGAEMCGPCFTPDGRTLFLCVQHPGEDFDTSVPLVYDDPPTRWPDFKPGMPPRPAVVVITKNDGGEIGS